MRAVLVSVESIERSMAGLLANFGNDMAAARGLSARAEALRGDPSRSGLIGLRESLTGLAADLDRLTKRIRDRRHALSQGYRVIYSSINMIEIGRAHV